MQPEEVLKRFNFPGGLPTAFSGQTQTKQGEDTAVVFVALVSSWEDKSVKLSPDSAEAFRLTTIDRKASLAETKAALLRQMAEGSISKAKSLELASEFNLFVEHNKLYFKIAEHMIDSVKNNANLALARKSEKRQVHLILQDLLNIETKDCKDESDSEEQKVQIVQRNFSDSPKTEPSCYPDTE